MSDIRTLHARVVRETKKIHSEDQASAMVAILDAMRFFQAKRFWFNEATGFFKTEPGVQEYAETGGAGLVVDKTVFDVDDLMANVEAALPGRVFRPYNVYYQRNGETWYPLDQKELDWIRWRGSSGHLLPPENFAWWDNRMIIDPIPDAEYLCRIDFIQDLVIPQVREGSDGLYGFTVSDDVETQMEETFTNGWIDHAEPLIRARAKWDLYVNVVHDFAAAQAMGGPLSGDGMGGVVGVEYRRLREQTTKLQEGTEREGWPLI